MFIKSKVLLPHVKLTIADLQLLNNVIIIKSKVLLPQVKLTITDLQLLPEGGEPYFW
jgi:metal-sulfur cluster biosynthetic enzyme